MWQKRSRTEVEMIPRFEAQVTHLHSGTIRFAADKSGGDVCVSILIIEVYHVSHAAWQKELIPLIRFALEEHAVNVAAYKEEGQQGASENLCNSCH